MEEKTAFEKKPIISLGGSVGGGRRKTLSTPVRYVINAVLVAAFIAIGELMIDGGAITRYQTSVLEQVGIYVIMAVSLNIATGYLGQLPLGHAGFMSVGGYSCAIFIMRMSDVMGVGARDFVTGTPAAMALFVCGLAFGGVCAAICGVIIGIPALRLKGDYLAIITLGFAEIIRVIMLNIDGVLGFDLTDSVANFLLARHPRVDGRALYLKLREKGVLVRHFDHPALAQYNRITVGSLEDMQQLLKVLKEILGEDE